MQEAAVRKGEATDVSAEQNITKRRDGHAERSLETDHYAV